MNTRRMRNRALLLTLLAVACGGFALRLPVVRSSYRDGLLRLWGSSSGSGPALSADAARLALPSEWRAGTRVLAASMRQKARPRPKIQLREGMPVVKASGIVPLAQTVILSDGFEGSFPGAWQLYVTGTESTTWWGRSSYRKASGSYSAWCAGGGSSPQSPGGYYVPNMEVWLEYGPFDLSDASGATIDFDLWNDCEASSTSPPPDVLTIWLSTDDFSTDQNMDGFYFYNTNKQWAHQTFNASEFNQISAVGSHTVYLAFIFDSDSNVDQNEGSYLDNVVIQKTTTGGTCSLSCSAVVPATATVGTSVSFAGSAVPSNCTGTPGYSWDFGDGTALSTQQSASHTYATAGNFSWTLTVSVAGQTCKQTGSITVSGGAQPPSSAASYTYWIPVASHGGGAQSSVWRTDLGVLNLGSAAANIEVVLHTSAGVNNGYDTIAANAQAIYGDIVDQLGYTGSAALDVRSDQPLYVTSRTYNQATAGTFGQDYDGVEEGVGAFGGQLAYLPQLTENAAYRTNISLTNTGATNATVLVELFNGSGSKLTDYTVSLAPGEWKQENKPFLNKAGQTDMAAGYARLTVTSGTGILASASVIDNATNDPTTVPMKFAPAANVVQWLPVVSHAAGAQGSQWRTDLGLLNLGTSAARVEIRLHTPSETQIATETLGPAGQAILVDVVNRFWFTGSAALEIAADQPVVVSSRTYNQGTVGTLGQDYTSALQQECPGTGEVVFLPQLIENSAYRTNIALTNTSTDSATATVELFAGNTKLTDYQVSLQPGEWAQENRPYFNKVGRTDISGGYAKVTVTQGAGVLATASVIDNVTNDPTTVPMKYTGAGTISGTVRTTTGAAVPGATVSAGGRTALTDASGNYTLPGVAARHRVVVTAHKDGYVDANGVAQLAANQSVTANLTAAVPKAQSSVVATAGGTTSTADGGLVTIPANALVKPDGTPFTGTASVTLTTFDPTNAGEADSCPGMSDGVTAGGRTVTVVNYGAVDVGLAGNGEKLNLASGVSATVQVPIPSALRAAAPASIPAFWLNPTDGRWHEQSVLNRSGNVYTGSLPHFTRWAADIFDSDPLSWVNGRIVDLDGVPVFLASAVCNTEPRGGAGIYYTDRDGRFNLVTRAGLPATLTAWSMNLPNSTPLHFTSAPEGLTIDIGDIVMNGRQFYTISGNAGMAGVTVWDSAGHSTTSDQAGNYIFGGVPMSHSVIVYAGLPGCRFNPVFGRSVTVPPDATGINFTPDPTCSTLPGPFALLYPQSGAVTPWGFIGLSWSPSAGATSYDVFFGTTAPPPLLVTGDIFLDYSVGVQLGQTYFWRVVAKNSVGQTMDSSGTWHFTVMSGTTPTPTPAPTGNATATPTPTGRPTSTPTPTGTQPATPTSTRTPTGRPTSTPTPTPTSTPTWTPTATPTRTSTPTPTRTPTPTPTPTVTRTGTPGALSGTWLFEDDCETQFQGGVCEPGDIAQTFTMTFSGSSFSGSFDYSNTTYHISGTYNASTQQMQATVYFTYDLLGGVMGWQQTFTATLTSGDTGCVRSTSCTSGHDDCNNICGGQYNGLWHTFFRLKKQ